MSFSPTFFSLLLSIGLVAAPVSAETLLRYFEEPSTRAFVKNNCDDGASPLWAQKRIAIDLMLEEVAQDGAIRVPPRVAVVDSGFDITQKKYFGSDVQAERGFKEVPDPTEDPSGHGTSVAGVIGGKNGVGGIPDAPLTVYRVTLNELGSAATLALHTALDRACQDGAEVINYSWGGTLDETGLIQDETWSAVLEKELNNQKEKAKITPLHQLALEKDLRLLRHIDQLGQRGCLVVKAAGNDHYRLNRRLDLDDAYLRVEASSVSSKLTEFSSNGEIRAPGERVYTVRSAQQFGDREPNRCKKGETDFHRVNGTSFAAPLAAGVAAQVLSYLKNSPFLNSIPSGTLPQKYLRERMKVALLSRILKASTFEQDINGLRAIRIAKVLRLQSAEDYAKGLAGDTKETLRIPTVEQLENMLRNAMAGDSLCLAQPPICEKSGKDVEACFNLQRKRLMLCGRMDFKERNQTLRDIIEIAQKNGASDLALGHVVNNFESNEVKVFASNIWKVAREQFPKSKFGFTLSISDLTLAMGIIPLLEQNEIREAFKLILHPGLKFLDERYLKLGINRGGEEFLSLYVNAIREIAQRYGIPFAVDLMKASVRSTDAQGQLTQFREPIAALRMIGAVLDAEPPFMAKGSPEVASLRLAERWFVQKLLFDPTSTYVQPITLLMTAKSSMVRNLDLLVGTQVAQSFTNDDVIPGANSELGMIAGLKSFIARSAKGELRISSANPRIGESILATWIISLLTENLLDTDALLVGVVHGVYAFESAPQSKKSDTFEMLEKSLKKLVTVLRKKNKLAEIEYLKVKLRGVSLMYSQSNNSSLRTLGLPVLTLVDGDGRGYYDRYAQLSTYYSFDEGRTVARALLRKSLVNHPVNMANIDLDSSSFFADSQFYGRILPYVCSKSASPTVAPAASQGVVPDQILSASATADVQKLSSQTLALCVSSWREENSARNGKAKGANAKAFELAATGRRVCKSLIDALLDSGCRSTMESEPAFTANLSQLIRSLNARTRLDGDELGDALELKSLFDQ